MRAEVFSIGIAVMALSALAFSPVPKESATALKVTRGKAFSSGAVFINGKYLEPPYVVERWGTGIRINGKFVTGQVIDWDEFIKTQAGSRAVKPDASADAPAVQPSAPAVSEDVDATSLDDLFDDDPKPKKAAKVGKAVARDAKPSTTYVFEGTFVPNETTKILVGQINAVRTEIDRTLRIGGFICFGDSYSRVTGDPRALLDFLKKLSACQKNAQNAQDFNARVRAAGMFYLNDALRRDLYRNRVDYRKLQEYCQKLKKDGEMQKILDSVSPSLF